MFELVVSNWICWLIVGVAWFAYLNIFTLYVNRHAPRDEQKDIDTSLAEQQMLPGILVNALPLLGLLGTISGLQFSFTSMMAFGVDSQAVSGGIADALLTTQLGLVLAIPGWLALVFVKGAVRKAWLEEGMRYAQ